MTKPNWLKKKLALKGVIPMQNKLRNSKLHSVCEEARCPNLTECFSKGVATVMIMGDTCTRACKFCAVKTGRPLALDPQEPLNTAEWVKSLGLKHVVITSVDRDDLKDLGSTHFAKTIEVVKKINPFLTVEILTPDFQGREECLKIVCEAEPHIYNHNLETTRQLTPHVRSASNYDRSLKVIHWVKSNFPHQITKSGLMLGLGESKTDVLQSMQDLINHGCDLLTLGQYLQPTPKHLEVKEYIHPDQFEMYAKKGREMGFKDVFAGPFVRSSYMADELYESVMQV